MLKTGFIFHAPFFTAGGCLNVIFKGQDDGLCLNVFLVKISRKINIDDRRTGQDINCFQKVGEYSVGPDNCNDRSGKFKLSGSVIFLP